MIDCLYDVFKEWSIGGSIYIISDPHFGDKDCKSIDRNWITPEEHVNIINKNIYKNDTLICLGDCGDLSYFSKINAKHKVLIKGNHDDGKKKRYYEIFDEVYDGPLFIAPKLVLSHEPLPVMPYYLNIHGHDHSDRSHSPYHINLAANIVNYQIFNLGKEIRKGILSPIRTIHRYTIDEAIKRKRGKHMRIFTIPKICPICGERTKIIVSDSGVENLICDNPNCKSKLINRLDHYAGKKGLDIKGLSKATLEKLIDWNWISSISDLYKLKDKKIEWGNKPGFGDKSVANILEAIEKSRYCSLEAFISACGIPLIGRTIAKELCNHFSSWESFREYIKNNKSFEEFYGFGYEMDKSLKDFDFTEFDNIKENFLIIENNAKSRDEKLKGKTFVVTGKLFTYKNRDAIKADIEGKGGKVASAISSKTSFLINNDINSTSSKNKKAKDLGIPIITEQDFINNYC